MKKLLRAILPLVVLGAAWLLVQHWIKNREEAQQRPAQKMPTLVEGTVLKKTKFPVVVKTFGTVQPRTETTLIPELPGKVMEISPALRPGGFFEKDAILLRIDPRDYETRLSVAKRNLAQAQSLLEVEKARGQQAVENWKRLGKQGEPSDLALRVPQMNEAKALAESAKAEVEKAERDLGRTEIRAPFAGHIVEKMVDVGQYVTTGTILAKAFAVDYVEVPLPITNQQIAYLDLPESYREGDVAAQTPTEVVLTGKIGAKEGVWKGRIIRVSGAFDEKTRQIYAVAQVDNPYGKRDDSSPPLKVGLFVNAEIKGKTLDDVFVIPSTAVRVSEEVILIDPQNRMWRRPVVPLLRDEQFSIVAAGKQGDIGLEEGEILCTTPIAFPVHGAPVIPTIDGKRIEAKALASVNSAKSKPKPAPEPKQPKPGNT